MRRAALAALVLCALYPATSSAGVSARDVAATAKYLRGQNADVLSLSAHLSESRADIDARGAEIARECPAVLTYAPRDEAFGVFGEELYTVLSDAGVAPNRAVLLRTSRATAHLTWTNRRLTRLVHRLAAEESGDATVAIPDVCTEIGAWKASDYFTLPECASKFLALSQAIESERVVGPSGEFREAAILHMLEPYETAADRRIAKRVKSREAQVDRGLYAATSAAAKKLGEALGAPTL